MDHVCWHGDWCHGCHVVNGIVGMELKCKECIRLCLGNCLLTNGDGLWPLAVY